MVVVIVVGDAVLIVPAGTVGDNGSTECDGVKRHCHTGQALASPALLITAPRTSPAAAGGAGAERAHSGGAG